MKVRIIQPPYTLNPEDLEENYGKMVALMRECNEPLDIVVLPEYCDIPAAQKGKAAYHASISRFNAPVFAEAVALAKRCHANVFINCAHIGDFGIRVNFFWADDPREAMALLDAGVDCVLTNDYLSVKNALAEKIKRA